MRTGETYQSIYEMLWSGSDDPETWVYKRRHTILGKWREIKLGMWGEHLYVCEQQAEWEAEQRAKACNVQALEPGVPAFMVSEPSGIGYNEDVPF
jgi:hypothetical protein